MKKLFILFLYIGISTHSLSQWSIFAGGGANMTTDCNKLGNPLSAKYDNVNNYSFAKKEYIGIGLGGGGEIGCSYVVKKHHFFLTRIAYSFQTYSVTDTITTYGMNPHGNYVPSTSYYDDKIQFHYIQIPFSYGYSICSSKKNTSFSFTPYIGWLNQFFLTNAYFDCRYYGFLQGGLRFKIWALYIDCSYNLLLTPYYDDAYPTTRLQTVNLSLGYVYTFKTKAERQKTKK